MTHRTIARLRLVLGALLAGVLPTPHTSAAQAQYTRLADVWHPSERPAEVWRERMVMRLPPPSRFAPPLDPPWSGWYAWRVAFGGRADATLAVRVDAPTTATRDRDVVRLSRVYRCPATATSVLACTEPLPASSLRWDGTSMVLEVRDTAFVRQLRTIKAGVAVRFMFAPAGRYQVDHVEIEVKP